MTTEIEKKQEVFEDYETTPVPEEKRYRWFSQGMIWAGSAFCLAAFSVGGMLAASMSFGSLLTAILLGCVIVTVIASLFGVIGAHTHLASAFTARFALGIGGSKVFGLIVALSLFGWFGYQCSYFASSTIATLQLFGFSGGSTVMWTVIGGVAMMITAVVGIKGIKWLSNIGVPLLFLLVVIAAVITLVRVDFSVLAEASAASAGGMTIPAAITIIVGSFIAGACSVPDITRFSKKKSDAVAGSIVGYLISFAAILLLGAMFYYAYSTSDLCTIFIQYCGLGVFAAFVLIISTWTTNDNNLYSSVLGITNALGDKVKVPRWLLTIIVGLVSTALGALGIVDYFLGFLNLLGVFIPPVAAVIIADFYLYNKEEYAFEKVAALPSFKVTPCVSALFGMLVGILCNYANIGFLNAICSYVPASIFAMVMAVVCLVVLNLITKRK
ncbi:MAG: cytosine permease [Oscillospiraceae bacterium]|nr:cytosine permease [Oscillospiraceae bacterium]